MTTETINLDGVFWICVCGNTPDTDGFEPCDQHGQVVSPDIDGPWDEVLWVCGRCARIIDSTNRHVVGFATTSNDSRGA